MGLLKAERPTLFNDTIGIKESSIKYVHKIFSKNKIFNPLIRTRSFSKNFAYVLDKWPIMAMVWMYAEFGHTYGISILYQNWYVVALDLWTILNCAS